MARPREFDEDVALEAATMRFWAAGYASGHAPMFDQTVERLRATHEWTFIDRGVDIRLERVGDVSATS